MNVNGDSELLSPILDALAQVRRAKTEAKVSQRAVVESATISVPSAQRSALDAGIDDLCRAGSIEMITVNDTGSDALTCDVTLAPQE